MPTIEEILKEELSEAVSNLVIEEDDDDQEKLREMILELQYQAFNRGLSMASANAVEEQLCADLTLDSEEATAMVKNLLAGGSALIALTVRD